jgi:hypothetical protein
MINEKKVETFTPDYVRVGSLAAAALCEWIISVYRFARYERKLTGRSNEMRDYQDLYTKRMSVLGEKRLMSEEMCRELERLCESRLVVLKEKKKSQNELDFLIKNRDNVKHLVSLLDTDKSTWTEEYARANTLIKTYKADALLTACYVCYAGIFDSENREFLYSKWLATMKKLSKHNSSDAHGSSHNHNAKYALRKDFNVKDVLLNVANESKELILQLNRMSLKDEFFIMNALILRYLPFTSVFFSTLIIKLKKIEAIELHLASVLYVTTFFRGVRRFVLI